LNIVLEKLKPYIEKISGDYQIGFMDGRSVIDNIFSLKIINKKIWEYNQSHIQYLFIDFQNAYDSIHKDMLWKCMEEFKLPTKLINMCNTCVQKTRSAVRTEGRLSSFLENKTRLKQGNFLSPILFTLALQKVIQSVQMVPSSIKISKEQLNISAYADDIILIGKNEIRQLFLEMENVARKLGLQINQEKIKYMILERKNTLKQNKIDI
jgi:hypothetical protein